MVPRLARRLVSTFCVLLAVSTLSFAAKTRRYYIAAEEVTWDYAPSGRDLIHGSAIPPPWNTQTRWSKTRYVEYTDATFSMRKAQPEWLGILGPVIRAEVGDTVLVDFLNRTEAPHSIHPHGLRYDKANEGAAYLPSAAGAAVAPGERFTYRWHADKGSGPGSAGPSSVVWWYHSHVDAEREINAGLLGPIIVTAAGMANLDGSPRDVDQEFVAMFMIFDELQGKDAGLFHSMNGYIFGNLPGLLIKQGSRVRWHLLCMGNEKDLHTPHWHGETVTYGQRHTDVVELLPGSMATVDMTADNPGTWMFHCHVSDHMEGGMMALYTVYTQPRSCPVTIVAEDWQRFAETARVRIRNTGAKPIRKVSLLSGYLMNTLDLEPLILAWFSEQPLTPGQEQTIEVGSEMFADKGKPSLGLAFYPSWIVYADGSEWKPRTMGECFHVYWRNKEHPRLPVLPPAQVHQHDDD
ncbi:MAG TPA: multicopper oxidase domain-containing protein [Candidatus Angelobacter sp.]|nr:multicopper oxidase domain-containing protein [Candidatus Angelobacter sp.]